MIEHLPRMQCVVGLNINTTPKAAHQISLTALGEFQHDFIEWTNMDTYPQSWCGYVVIRSVRFRWLSDACAADGHTSGVMRWVVRLFMASLLSLNIPQLTQALSHPHIHYYRHQQPHKVSCHGNG